MKSSLQFKLILASLFFLYLNEASAQWYSIPQLKYTNIYCTLTVNDSTVFVGGDFGTLLRSSDNGISWTNVYQNVIEADTILSLGKGLGYIFAGANGVNEIYRSSDNGNSWSAANSGLPGFLIINQFAFVDSMLYTATSGGVFGSADSSKTWQAYNAGLDIGLIEPGLNWGTIGIVAVGSNLYTVKSMGSYVYMTRRDTIAWKPISTTYYGIGYAMAAVDTNIFVANQEGIFLYKGDSVWAARNSGLPVNDTTSMSSCILTVSDSLLFAYIFSNSTSSYSRDIYVTSNLGETWKKVNDSVSASGNINAITANKKYLFAGTQMGEWRLPISSIVTSVKEDKMQTPSGYYLSQNYPNPFNPNTVINYQLSAYSHVTLKVYDVLGRLVNTLIDGYKSQGNYSVNFDAADLASGIYFYQLKAGNFTETKKLSLLK